MLYIDKGHDSSYGLDRADLYRNNKYLYKKDVDILLKNMQTLFKLYIF